MPVVQYTVNGVSRWAFALGTVDEVDASPSGFGTAVGTPDYPTISVRLLAAMGNVPGVPNPPGLVELVLGLAAVAPDIHVPSGVSANPPTPQGRPARSRAAKRGAIDTCSHAGAPVAPASVPESVAAISAESLTF